MSFKKLICIITAAAILFLFASCKKNTEADATKKNTDVTTTKKREAVTVKTEDEKVYEIREEKDKNGTVTITVYPYGEEDESAVRSLKYGLNTSKNDGTYFVEITDFVSGNFVMYRTNSVSKDSVKNIKDSIYYDMLFAGLDGTVSENDATEKIVAVVGEGERESVFCEGFEVSDGILYYVFFIEKHDQTPAYYRVNVTTGEVTLKTASGVLI